MDKPNLDAAQETRPATLKEEFESRLLKLEDERNALVVDIEDAVQRIDEAKEDIETSKQRIKDSQEVVSNWKKVIPGRKQKLAAKVREIRVMNDAIKKL